MSFVADKQTLDDLNLLRRYRNDSIYALFNQVHTSGGEKLMDKMFRYPLDNADEINRRSGLFKYFEKKGLRFPLNKEQFGVVENYLGSHDNGSYAAALFKGLRKKALSAIFLDEAFKSMQKGLEATIDVLTIFFDFMLKLEDTDRQHPYHEELEALKKVVSDHRLSWLTKEKGSVGMSVMKVIRYDYLLRNLLKDEMGVLLDIIHRLDIYIAVAGVAKARGFAFAHALPKDRNILDVRGFHHPALPKGVNNALTFNQENNVLFLTGANMAGKSTLMKSFGIAVYLAHMGFPVAAEKMEFSVRDGLYSSINVPDNISQGYSHFYAEVLRVKKIAEEVSSSRDLVVIFDELFKGTNVKDAYDATLAVTEAFSDFRNCFFIISTHIIEVGEQLMKGNQPIQFSYLPTIMDGVMPRYTYKLQEGITSDRHGMMIIHNERILEIIKGAICAC
ncbi:MAG TPA: hypothetical protein VNS58_07340 [Puia sp.]|nr:hypothetical protein [Puia sp.]